MRVRVSHQTTYTYAAPARSVIQTLRLTPRSFDGQRVSGWRTDVNLDCRLIQTEDTFGNIVHTFNAEGPVESMTIAVDGEIETSDTAGMIRGAIERFPTQVYLRDTSLTCADQAIRNFAREATSGCPQDLQRLHALMSTLHALMTFDADMTHAATTAGEAFALKRGVCQDFAHIFIAAARYLGIPARYISGYFLRTDGLADQDAGHAWAEAWIDDLGWIGFDPTHCVSPHEQHVRIACALDYLGAAPVRGSRNGGGDEKLEVSVRLSQSQHQSQG